jgi:hypothetical protein
MKRMFIFLLGGIVIFLLGSCQRPVTKPGKVEVLIEGNGQFPGFLVGRWKDKKEGWEFTFEPNGAISSAVFSLGRVTMKPGQITRVPAKMGGEGIFEPGEWEVYYTPSSRELTVRVSLKDFRVQMGDNALAGKSTDVFVGPVSEDGKLWHVEWVSLPDYTASISKQGNVKLPVDPNYGIINTLLFEKTAEK